MRWFIVLAISVLVGVLAFMLFSSNTENTDIVDMTGRDAIEIVLTDNGYEPRHVRVDKGTTITFSTTRDNQHWPASNLHPSHDIYTEFDPKRPLESDEEWSFTFDQVGTWGMHDHVRSYFTGTIYVSE